MSILVRRLILMSFLTLPVNLEKNDSFRYEKDGLDKFLDF